MYKSVEFLRVRDPARFYNIVDWIESKGLLKPATVLLKDRMSRDPDTFGIFRPDRKRIYIYNCPPEEEAHALAHELVHNYQFDGNDYEVNPRFVLDIPPLTKRQKYLLDPIEVEAYYYSTLFFSDTYHKPYEILEEYESMGVHLSQL